MSDSNILSEIKKSEAEARKLEQKASVKKDKIISEARKAAQKMIIAVGIEPSSWFYSHYELYDYLYLKKFSIKYGCAILKVANLWGFFFCKKTGRAFMYDRLSIKKSLNYHFLN